MNKSLENDDLVQMANDEKVKVLRPAIVYIAILMASGLIGNLMVVFFYGFKTKPVTTSIFIVTMAIYDLIVCSVSMPTEIVDIVRFYTFENGTACKILRFINYTAAIASGFTLVTIAVDRFKHIRRTTGKQMTVRDAKKYCIIVAGGTILLSWPILFLFNSEQVQVSNDYGLDVTGYDCTMVKSNSYKPYVFSFNIVLLLGFIVCTVVLTVLYGMVAWAIYKHRKRLTKYTLDLPNTSESHLSSSHTDTTIVANIDETDIGLETSVITKEDNTQKADQATNKHSQSMYSKAKIISGSVKKSHNDTIRLTLLMLAITIVFVISFLPYLSLVIWRSLTGIYEGDLSTAELVGFEIASRSFLLNSSCNPWIYGIFNSRFRLYFYKLLCCKNKP